MLDITNTTKQKINRKIAVAITESLLNFYKKNNSEVSLVIIGSKKMRSLNRDFRGIDKTTDVLSFPGLSGQAAAKIASPFLGEIFINIQETGRPKKYLEVCGERKSRAYIFYFLLVHGLLHLLGYDDQMEKSRRAMIILGERFLSGFFKKKVL